MNEPQQPVLFFIFLVKFYKFETRSSVILGYGVEDERGLWFKYRAFVEAEGYHTRPFVGRKGRFIAAVISASKELSDLVGVYESKNRFGTIIRGLSELETPLTTSEPVIKLGKLLEGNSIKKAAWYYYCITKNK